MLGLPEEEQYRLLWEKYGLSEEKARALKGKGFSYYDLDKGSMYAYVAQKPLEEVLELRRENLPEKLAHMAELKSSCLERLLTIPGMERVGDGEAPHILCMSLPGYPSANIITELGEQDICISAGSACHKGKASHVFTAMGLPGRTAAGAFRVSFGPETTEADIDALYEALKSHQANRFPML